MAIQYDERGRPFILMPDGKRNYISPAAYGQAPPPDETGIFRQAPQWNQDKGAWQTPIDWTNIANIAVGTGLTAGAVNAFLPAAAPLAAPASQVPTATAPLASAVPAAAPLAAAVPAATAPIITGGILPAALPSTTTAVTGGTLAAIAPAAAPIATGAGMDLTTGLLWGGSTLANLYGARQASNAAKDAAKIQSEAADKALAFQQKMWEDTQRNQAPWLQAGTGAINTLANLTGVPMMTPGTSPVTSRPATQPIANIAGARSPSPTAVLTGSTAVPRGTMPLSAAPSQPVMAGRSSYVTLQAPDGSTQQVPEQFASAFEAKGARRVA